MGLDGAHEKGPGSAQAEGFDIVPLVRRGLRYQSLVALAIAGTLAVAAGPVECYSALFGSLAAFVPAWVFAGLVARKFGGDSAAFLRAAVIAEGVKLLLIALICMAVFLWVEPLAAGWFFTGMIAVILTGYLHLFLGG